jgi:putative spermidine/putrescine transport system substrate-binding protein
MGEYMSYVIRRIACAAAIAILASAFGNSATRADPLVVAGWVGPYEAALRKEFFPAFEKKYGTKIEYLSASSFINYGRLKAERNNPQVDVALLDDIILDQARKDGLLAPLDTSIVLHLADINKDAHFKDNMGVGIGYNVVSMYYNTKIFQEKGFAPPTSWNDLFRPELKGHVVIRNISSSYGLYPLLMLARINGGSDADAEPGFAKLKELAPNVISFPTSHGPQAQMTLQGEAWIGVTGLGEFQDFIDKKAPLKFVVPKEGAIALVESAAVVKNARHGKLAQQFINELTSPEGQRMMAIALSYLPTNSKTPLDDEVKARLPLDFSDRENLKVVDFDAVMANREKWNERFNKEIANP